jgi:hypothetical protein
MVQGVFGVGVRAGGVETQQRFQTRQLGLSLLDTLGSGDVLRSRRDEDPEIEFFEQTRSGSKRLSKDERPTPMKDVSGDLSSTALVDGPVVEDDRKLSVRAAGLRSLVAL